MELGRFDPRRKENWRFTTNIWYWVMMVAVVGFLIVCSIGYGVKFLYTFGIPLELLLLISVVGWIAHFLGGKRDAE